MSTPSAGSRARAELAAAALLCAVGGGLLLLAASQPWAQVSVSGVTGSARPVSAAAAGASPAGLGLLGLAGVAGLFATRRRGRVLIGVLLLLAGAGAIALAVHDRAGLAVAASLAGPDAAIVGGRLVVNAWPWVAVAGGALLAAGGLLVTVRGMRWAALSQRHDAPATEPEQAAEPDPAAAAWDALDRGDDPTR